jgi:hypothetical protein
LEVPVGLTPIGSNTIEVLRLDKHEARLTHLKWIREIREYFVYLMNRNDPEAQAWAERFYQVLTEAVHSDKPYSAMVADYLAANPLPDRPA